MKVVQILYSGLGGHGSVVFSMIDADKDKIWDNVLVFYGIEDLKPEYEQLCRKKGIPFYFFKKVSKVDIKAAKAIIKVVDKERPNRIILHTTTLAPYLLFLPSAVRDKIIFVEHTPNALKPRFEQFSSFVGMIAFSKVVYLTTMYKEEMRRKLKFLYRDEKVHVIPNGIDVEFFQPSDESKQHSAIFITMVARFSATKDQLTLLKAFGKLLKQSISTNFKLVLAGDGETKTMIEAEIEKDGLKENCILTGTIQERDVRDLLQRTNFYVHSTLSETMSTSIMQAMACGLPVIASDIPGVSNMLEHNQYGVLVSPMNVSALAQAIESLINNPDETIRLAKRARQKAEAEFSSKITFRRYNELVIE